LVLLLLLCLSPLPMLRLCRLLDQSENWRRLIMR
jgi:hypothetical protein